MQADERSTVTCQRNKWLWSLQMNGSDLDERSFWLVVWYAYLLLLTLNLFKASTFMLASFVPHLGLQTRNLLQFGII